MNMNHIFNKDKMHENSKVCRKEVLLILYDFVF